MKQIAFYGAFDRFNYGDMLFPIILEKALEDWHPEYERRFYGVIQSNLSAYGGIPTEDVETLFSENNLEDGSIVIIVGGEVLSPTWLTIFSFLVPDTLEMMIGSIYHCVPKEYLSSLRPNLHPTNLLQPFVIEPADFSKRVLIAYNAVGGQQISSPYFPKTLLKSIQEKLQNANFISIRDQGVFNFLSDQKLKIKPILSPDSASLVSHFYPKNELANFCGVEISSYINEFRDNYIVFQVGNNYLREKEDVEIVKAQIENVYKTYGLPAMLCPIGMAAGHLDQVPLRKLSENICTPHFLVQEPTIFDIMASIANARVFIGTSLHGAITSMAYCVPNLILTSKVPKLIAYIEKWGLPELKIITQFDSIFSNVQIALNTAKTKLLDKNDELTKLSLENIEYMKNTLESCLTDEKMTAQTTSFKRKSSSISRMFFLELRDIAALHLRLFSRVFRRAFSKIRFRS